MQADACHVLPQAFLFQFHSLCLECMGHCNWPTCNTWERYTKSMNVRVQIASGLLRIVLKHYVVYTHVGYTQYISSDSSEMDSALHTHIAFFFWIHQRPDKGNVSRTKYKIHLQGEQGKMDRDYHWAYQSHTPCTFHESSNAMISYVKPA